MTLLQGDWFLIDFEEDGTVHEVEVEVVGLLAQVYVVEWFQD